MKKKAFIFLVLLLALPFSSAAIKNVSVELLTVKNYTDIWLGVSTGGYELIAKKNSLYEFEVYIKNGMADRTLHNLEYLPIDFPFQIISITPKIIEDLKPMEIRVTKVIVNVSDIELSKYPILFYLRSNEFPEGIFQLQSEIKVVDRIPIELYILYSLFIIAIFILLFYRKKKFSK